MTSVAVSRDAHRRVDTSLLVTGLIGLILTSVLYVAVFFPVRQTVIGQLFVARGWVPYVIVLLVTWSAAILAHKFRHVRRERGAIDFGVLPSGTVMRRDNVDDLAERVAQAEARTGPTFLTRRFARALACFRSRGSTQEVASLLSSQSELDALSVESSYTMLRVFIWAVPILGFIGTVLGIGHAVNSFSTAVNAAQDVDTIKNSLSGVTGGLAVAFDTTLVALVMSILLMIPTNWLQKAEEDVLNEVTDCCNRDILVGADEERAVESTALAVRAALSDLLEAQRGRQDALARELEGAGARIAADLREAWRDVDAAMRESHVEHARVVAEAMAGAAREAGAQTARGFGALLEEVRAAREQDAQGVRALCERVGTERDAFLEGAGAVRDELRHAATSLAAAADRSVQAIEALRAGQAETVERAVRSFDELRQGQAEAAARAERAFAEQREEQAGAAARATTALAQEWRRLADTAAALGERFEAQEQRLAATAEALHGLARSTGEALPEALTRQLHALEKTAYGYERLYAAQKVVGSNLRKVALSADWKTLMASLDRRLDELGTVLAGLDRRLRPKPRFLGVFGGGAAKG